MSCATAKHGDTWSRRAFLHAAGAATWMAAIGCGRPAFLAPRSSKIQRVGYVGSNQADHPAPLGTPYRDAFLQGLAEHGYVEGQNVVLEYRFAEGNYERLPELIAELVQLPVDVLVLADTRAIGPARQVTRTTPVVMVLSTDPVGAGAAASLARPGGNLTGMTMAPAETTGKRVQLLQETVPTLQRVGWLFNPADGFAERARAELTAAAAVLGLEVVALSVPAAPELPAAFAEGRRQGVGGLLVHGDPLTNRHIATIAELAIAAGLPSMGMNREMAVAGLLLAYAPSLPALFHRAASYVDRLLRGTPPAEIPIERPMRFEFIVNLHTARALGIEVPRHVLLDATEVVQ